MAARRAASAVRPAGPQPAGPARRRAHLNGRYFALSWQRTGPQDEPADEGGDAKLMMAVPKKLVPSAPLRNTVRRVVREAVRAAGIDAMPAALVRLVALPTVEPAATGAAPGATASDAATAPSPSTPARPRARGRPERPFDRRLPDGALKRACRQDADALLARLKLALASRPR